MITVMLIVHGLAAVALLGAITHQAFSVARRPASRDTFARKFRSVSSPAFVNAIVILFAFTFILGGLLYPAYRLDVRPLLEDMGWRAPSGIFEIKEHLAAIGLGTLPVYWHAWRANEPAWELVRRNLTWLLAFVVWFSFLTGHILNNLKGLV